MRSPKGMINEELKLLTVTYYKPLKSSHLSLSPHVHLLRGLGLGSEMGLTMKQQKH